MLCLDMSKCQFNMENINVIPIIRTNYHSRSSLEVRVLCKGKGGKLSLIGQKCKMADGKQPSDWTIIQDGNLVCDWTRIQDGK